MTITLARLCSMSGVQRLIQCDALLLRRKLVTPKAVVFSRVAQVGGSVVRSQLLSSDMAPVVGWSGSPDARPASLW